MVGKAFFYDANDFLFAQDVHFGHKIANALGRNPAYIMTAVALDFPRRSRRFYGDFESVLHSIQPPPTMQSSSR